MPKPSCSICGKVMTIISVRAGALYDGVICAECNSLICISCQGNPPSKPCKKCGGQVRPAYADIIASRKKWWQFWK